MIHRLLGLPALLFCLYPLSCADSGGIGTSPDTSADQETASDLGDTEGQDAAVDGVPLDLGDDSVHDGAGSDTTDPGDSTGTDPEDLDGNEGGSDWSCDGKDCADADSMDVVFDTVTPASLFDLPAIRNASTAACAYTDQRTGIEIVELVDVWSVSYESWESIDGVLVPITIRGYAARPAGQSGTMPGVVLAHGLGGQANEGQAVRLAAQLDAFVIAYTGPGGGNTPANTSEGRPATYDGGYRLWDVLTDPRGSWFWGHAVAAMRAITCLETRNEVDPDLLGITGFSAGAVVSLMASGVDDRIVAAVPLSGTGSWDIATESPQAWQHGLLAQAGLTIESPEWIRFQETLDPTVLVPGTSTAILMINGTCDEFFPLTAHMATYRALGTSDRRMSLVGNFDHGCYSFTGVEDDEVIEERQILHQQGGQRMWFGHWFGTDPDFSYIPQPPVVTITPIQSASYVTAVVDAGGSSLAIDEVRVWWSNTDSLVYVSDDLEEYSGSIYTKLVPFPLEANSITFVDVQYKTDDLVFPVRFSISSEPSIPEGFVPTIRSMSNCLPP